MRLKYIYRVSVFSIFLSLSCATKKDIIYLQDNAAFDTAEITAYQITIQPDDILKITVGALVPEAALAYNKVTGTTIQGQNIEAMKLEGYVVSKTNTIEFPVLGTVEVSGRTTTELAGYLQQRLEEEGHLNNATVDVRLLNAKFTVLGEVNQPGTYNFTETRISVFQALGLAGDLNITGQRDDVLLIRERDGERSISHIDLTTTAWFNSDLYYIQPNDVLVVNPNVKKVKSSGMVGDTSTILGVASLVISITILLTQ